MTDILPFFFDDAPVRVILRDDVPWWVLNDICAILAIANPRDAARRLYDWQRDDVGITDAIGRMQQTTIINEPGVYKLILNSRKPEAERFEYWLTAEVLPTLRRTGSYSMAPARPVPLEPLAEVDLPRFQAAISAVQLMRRLRGNAAALLLWEELGLPMPGAPIDADEGELARRVRMWADGRDKFTNDEVAAGIGLARPDNGMRQKFGDVLRLMGYENTTIRRGRRQMKGWVMRYPGPVIDMAPSGEMAA